MADAAIAPDVAAAVRQADEDAADAAEAFALGKGDEYLALRTEALMRRLEARYGDTGAASGDRGASG